jgi:hypothetical protein
MLTMVSGFLCLGRLGLVEGVRTLAGASGCRWVPNVLNLSRRWVHF